MVAAFHQGTLRLSPRIRAEIMQSLLQPEAILPEQFMSTSHAAMQPERRLMLAVLQDAVMTLVRHSGDQHPRLRNRAREVERWLEPQDVPGPFSYENICAVLGIDPDAFRRALAGLLRLRNPQGSAGLLPALARRTAAERHRVTVHRKDRGTRSGRRNTTLADATAGTIPAEAKV